MNFELKSKDILQLFLGDAEVSIPDNNELGINGYNISMPYLTHAEITGVGATFGINSEEIVEGNRLERMSYITQKIIQSKKETEFLNYFLDKSKIVSRYTSEFSLYTDEELSNLVSQELKAYEKYIKRILKFSNKKLVKGTHGYTILPITDNSYIVSTDDVESKIDVNYVQRLVKHIKQSLDEASYDSLVTQCRILIEEINVYILENNMNDYKSNGDINKQNQKVKKLLNINQKSDYDKRVNEMLGGLDKIVNAIAKMRNDYSDSHGVGSRRIKINKREAKLIMNATFTYCNYITEVYVDKREKVEKDDHNN